MYQSLIKKFQAGYEGSIEKKFPEIDFIFFARKRGSGFVHQKVPAFDPNFS